MLNSWMDASLKRWSKWYIRRFEDKSMGYPKKSPIEDFGMPGRTGRVFDLSDDCKNEIDEECEQLHNIMRKELSKQEFNLVYVYYVRAHCVHRRAAMMAGVSTPTIKKYIGIIVAKIVRLTGERDRVKSEAQMKITKLPTAKRTVLEQLDNCKEQAEKENWDDVVVIFTTKDGDYGAWQTVMPIEKACYMAACYQNNLMCGDE